MSDCLFCRISAKEIPSNNVFENADIYAFHDINPVAPVHIVIIPKKHIAYVADITTEAEVLLMGKLIQCANAIARDLGIAEQGYRLVFNNGKSAGQEVFHIHLHLLGGRDMIWPPG